METKITLSLEDQQFIKTVRAAFGEVKAFTDSVRVAQKHVTDLGKTAATGSITDLTNRVTSARKAVEGAIPGTQQYENAIKRLQVVSNLADRAQSGLANRMRGNVKPGTNEAAYALFNFNRIVSDSAYGILGMANNIEPFVISAQSAIKASGGFKAALSGILTSLAGPTGFVTLISFAQSALVLWSMHSRKSKEDSDKQKKAIDDLKEAYKDLTRAQLQNELAKQRAKWNELPAFVREEPVRNNETGQVTFVKRRNLPDNAKTIDEAIRFLEQELLLLGDKNNIEKELAVNEKRLGQLNKDNVHLYKDVGNTYDEVKTKLENWIKSEQAALDVYSGKNQQTYIEIQQEELRLHQLRFQWGSEDLNNYRIYLQEKLSSIRTSNAEELELAISLREELNRVNDIDLSGIKARGVEDLKVNFGLMDAMPGIKGGIATQLPTIDMSRWGGKDIKKLSEGMMMVKTAFQEAGAAMVDAMFGVKTSITEVIAEIGKLIVKTLVLKAIETGFNYLFAGAGSVAGSALGGFSGGSNFADAYTMAAGNKFAGIAQNNGINININGTMEASQNKFIMDFAKAQKKFNYRLID